MITEGVDRKAIDKIAARFMKVSQLNNPPTNADAQTQGLQDNGDATTAPEDHTKQSMLNKLLWCVCNVVKGAVPKAHRYSALDVLQLAWLDASDYSTAGKVFDAAAALEVARQGMCLRLPVLTPP